MFKSLNRVSVLKCVLGEGLTYSPRTSHWIQICRRASGLKEKKAEELENITDEISFTSFIQQRQEEAKRSFIVKSDSPDVWPNFLKLVHKHGPIKNIFQYSLGSSHFLLIELKSSNKLKGFLKQALKIQNSSYLNQFLVLNKSTVFDECTKDGSETKKISHYCEQFNCVSTISHRQFLNKQLYKSKISLTDLIYNCWSDLKVTDFEVRKRFLMCRQLETLCSGFIPNAVALPFGSSINGFGMNDCDLDISLIPFVKNNDSIFCKDDYLNLPLIQMKADLSAITELSKSFLTGCTNFFFVKNAKVPILKYKHLFVNVDCDLSLYNLHGIAFSQILYTTGLFDHRLRAIVIFLKLWAQKVGLVMRSPSRTLSNFSLCLLTVFFFQQIKIIPPWSVFPCEDEFFLKGEDLIPMSYIIKKRNSITDDKSAGELLKYFFEYYSNFDFNKWGISLVKGEVISNKENCPIYIENPIIPNVNICKNVGKNEMNQAMRLFDDVIRVFNNSSEGDIMQKLFHLNCGKARINLSDFV